MDVGDITIDAGAYGLNCHAAAAAVFDGDGTTTMDAVRNFFAKFFAADGVVTFQHNGQVANDIDAGGIREISIF